MPRFKVAGTILLMMLLVSTSSAQPATTQSAAGGKLVVAKLVDQPDDWFTGEGQAIVSNLLTWQNLNGGWWKAYDPAKPNPESAGATGKKNGHDSGFDNGATYSELRILARAYRVRQAEEYKLAFERGLKFTLASQYPNGGWPQRLPIKATAYYRQITFNDDAMVNVLRLLKDIVEKRPDFAFVSDADRELCKASFEKGIDCILKCQIKVNEQPTVWCQQHDAQTLAPTNARAYELPSFCSAESAGIVLLLMSINAPSTEVRQAVEGAVKWFESAKIVGKRYERVRKPGSSKVSSVVFEDDANAPLLWARFYDLETGKPFFCDRDGVKRPSLDDIGKERRNGYAWYNVMGNKVLAEYPKWKERSDQRAQGL